MSSVLDRHQMDFWVEKVKIDLLVVSTLLSKEILDMYMCQLLRKCFL